MRDQTVEFAFLPDDEVVVKQFKITGSIETASINRTGNKRYWIEWTDSDQNVVGRWFDENQLEAKTN